MQGTLLSNASNSLGTNSISVAAGAALETTYNINNTNGVLFLNGQMYLYTDDTFYGLVINSSNVPPGTYTFAQLNSTWPANFPATWPVQLGSVTGTNTGPGSIKVLATLPPSLYAAAGLPLRSIPDRPRISAPWQECRDLPVVFHQFEQCRFATLRRQRHFRFCNPCFDYCECVGCKCGNLRCPGDRRRAVLTTSSGATLTLLPTGHCDNDYHETEFEAAGGGLEHCNGKLERRPGCLSFGFRQSRKHL